MGPAKKDYAAPTPLWGFCGHPLVDGNRLVCLVGGEGSVAVAFECHSWLAPFFTFFPFLGMREEVVVQRSRRMDHYADKQSTIEFPKMRAISRDKGIAFDRYRGGENKPILLWQAMDVGPNGRRSDR